MTAIHASLGMEPSRKNFWTAEGEEGSEDVGVSRTYIDGCSAYAVNSGNAAQSTAAQQFSPSHPPFDRPLYGPSGVAEILEKVCDWSGFDVFELAARSGGQPLQHVTLRLLTTLGVVKRLHLSVTRLSAFLAAAEAQYTSQPYHNNTHAADVVQALGSMMAADQWASTLNDCEVLALVVAAAVHDLGHPGVNNDFHARTNSKEAKLYRSVGSINENGHAALALALLDAPDNDFLSVPLGATGISAFKGLVKDLVLSTDMAHHAGTIDEFSGAVRRWGPALGSWPAEERRGALRMLLHCADISNPARPLSHCMEWGYRVQEELYGQGDRERELGLALTPACDRNSGKSTPGRSQAAFIKHAMRPCIAALQPLAPNFVAVVTPFIDASLAHWQALPGGGESPTKSATCTHAGRNGSADVINYLAP